MPDVLEASAPEATTFPGGQSFDDIPDQPPPGFMDDIEPKFEDDEPESAVEETAKAEDTKPEVTAETPVSSTDMAATETPEFKEKAERWDQFDDALKNNTSAVAKAILEGMDARDRAHLLQAYNPRQATDFNVEEYEPNGDMEAELKSRWADLDAIPQLSADARSLAKQVEERHNLYVPHISGANVAAETALAQIGVIAEALGISFGDVDTGKLQEALKDKNYRDAVRGAVDYSKQKDDLAQRFKVRPSTPGNESRREEPIAEGTSMVEIARRMGAFKR